MVLTVQSEHFPQQHYMTYLYNGDYLHWPILIKYRAYKG